jgi:hypothetical protein
VASFRTALLTVAGGTNFALDTNHPKKDGKMTNVEVEVLFRDYGYEVTSEANPLLTTWARPK